MNSRYPVLGLLLILVVVLPTAGFRITLPNSTVHHQERTMIKTDYSTRQAALPTRWNKTYGSSDFDFICDVVECSIGGFVFTGVFSVSVTDQDLWLVKTDIHGNQLWNHSWGYAYQQAGFSLAECSDGGFIITGRTSSPREDVWLVRTNATGHQLWNQTFDGDLGDDDTGVQVIECSGGGFAIIGYTNSSKTNSQDLWLIRTDALGQHVWNETFGYDQEDWGYSIVECSDGGFAVCGYVLIPNQIAGILIRTDASGNQQWNQSYGIDNMGHMCMEVIECSSDGFALSGTTSAYGAVGGGDMWLLRTNADGDHLWNQSFDASDYDEAWDLVECSDGGFALSGTGNYDHDWISPPPTSNLGESRVRGYDYRFWAGESDIWLVRTDASGNHLWNQSYGGPGEEWGFSLITCSDGGFLLTGQLNTQGPSGMDGWLVRVAYDNLPPTWMETPIDQVVIVGTPFRYDLNASDPEDLLGSWSINDTSNFAVDAQGVITNASVLALGSFGVRVSVNDSHGNVLTGTFTASVQMASIPPIPGFPVIAIVVGVAAALGVGLVTRRRRSL